MKELSHIHRAMKNAKSEVDFDDKGRVQTVLSKNFGIPSLMDEVIFINKLSRKIESINQANFKSKDEIYESYYVHFPDLVIRIFRRLMVVEIDGDVHWKNDKAVKRTNERNQHYELAEIPMLWLTKKEAQDENIIDIIHSKLGEILGKNF